MATHRETLATIDAQGLKQPPFQARDMEQNANHPTFKAGAQAIPQDLHGSVKLLAAAYRGFTVALAESDSIEIVHWGRILLADQAATGLQLIASAVVDSTVKVHAQRLKGRGLN